MQTKEVKYFFVLTAIDSTCKISKSHRECKTKVTHIEDHHIKTKASVYKALNKPNFKNDQFMQFINY